MACKPGGPRPTADIALANLTSAKLPFKVSLHELQRAHHLVSNAVAPGGFELWHDRPVPIYHDAVLSYGAAPVRFVRAMMLD